MRFHGFSIFTASILLGLLVLGCTRREAGAGTKDVSKKEASLQHQKEERLDYLPQIPSVSIAGPSGALVLARDRASTFNMRLTAEGGQSWQELRRGKQGAAVTATTVAASGSTWGVNRQGEVFTANSPAGSWRMISNLKAASGGDFMEAEQIEFPTETDGWIRDLLCIWHTKDGGNTWKKSLSVSTDGVKGQPSRIFPIDENLIVVAGTGGQIYRSGDAGRTWQIKTLIDVDADLTDVSFSDKQNGFAVGFVSEPSFRPLIFITKDGGETWLEMPTVDQIRPWSVWFINNEGWLAGNERPGSSEQGISSKPVLLHTLDGGLNWARVAVSANDPFFSLVRLKNGSFAL